MINGVNSVNPADFQKKIDQARTFENFDLAHTYVIPMTGNSTTTQMGAVEATKKDNNSDKDDKNDGKIGFWSAAGHFAKGVGKFFWGMVSDEEGNFSIGQALKTVAIGAGIAAAAAIVPGAGAALALGFLAHGGYGMAKSIYHIATAKTDAEDALAWENLGSSTTETGLAFWGAKKTGAFDKAGKAFKAIKTSSGNVYNGYRSGGWSQAKATLIQEGENAYNFGKTNIYDKSISNFKALTDNAKLNLDKIKKSGTESKDAAFNEGVDAIRGKNQAEALREIRDLQTKVQNTTDAALKEQAQAKLDGAIKAYKESANHNQYTIADEALRKSQTESLETAIKQAEKNISDTSKDLAKATSELKKNPTDAGLKANVDGLQRMLNIQKDALAVQKMAKTGINGPTYKYIGTETVREGIKTPGYNWITVNAAGRGYYDAA